MPPATVGAIIGGYWQLVGGILRGCSALTVQHDDHRHGDPEELARPRGRVGHGHDNGHNEHDYLHQDAEHDAQRHVATVGILPLRLVPNRMRHCPPKNQSMEVVKIHL